MTPFFFVFIFILNSVLANAGDDSLKPNLDLVVDKFSVNAEADILIAKAYDLKLYEDKQWLDLLHIRPNVFGLSRSQITGKNFFLAVDGYKNSKSELEASIRELLTTKEYADDKHPLCSFPARKRWLKEKLQISDDLFPKVKCPLFNYYTSRLNADSVSIVFSSYYPNNPGSVFGHTLFRINKKLVGFEKRNELLDHGIGYAANANIDNPILYAAYGLFGGFKGVFTNVPYYYKVREYNDFESRSLWSYDLNLTPEEINYLVDHLWEVGSSYFDYYFFTQNCGFHMLTVLEAAVPRLRVSENIPLWVIPSDAVKVINQEKDLVKNISYRASVEEKFYKRWNGLSPIEKKYFLQWKQNKSFAGLETLSEDERIHILDAVMDYFDYKNPNVQEAGYEILQKERNQLLLARARIQKASPDLEIEMPYKNRPDFGHGSGRLGLHIGESEFLALKQKHGYQELQLRFALHDLLDAPYGYPPGANIEFMNFRFRHWQNWRDNSDQTFASKNTRDQLEEFTLFRLISLFPIDEFHKSPSWNFSVTSKRVYDQKCWGCYAGGIEGGAGGTLRSSIYNTDFFVFFNSSLLYSKDFVDSHLAWKAGPQLGLLYHFENFYVKIDADINWFLNESIEGKKMAKGVSTQAIEFRHNLANEWSWGLKVRSEDQKMHSEFSLNRFF